MRHPLELTDPWDFGPFLASAWTFRLVASRETGRTFGGRQRYKLCSPKMQQDGQQAQAKGREILQGKQI